MTIEGRAFRGLNGFSFWQICCEQRQIHPMILIAIVNVLTLLLQSWSFSDHAPQTPTSNGRIQL
jgi:hypothetical protein